jgi:hypothetical protein
MFARRSRGVDLLLRDDGGWQITDAGRAFLASVETTAPLMGGLRIEAASHRCSFPVWNTPSCSRLLIRDETDGPILSTKVGYEGKAEVAPDIVKPTRLTHLGSRP